jgi:hypothetical protein
MKIDDKMINYEIGKQLPKTTQNAMEDIKEKQLSDEQNVEKKIDQDKTLLLTFPQP